MKPLRQLHWTANLSPAVPLLFIATILAEESTCRESEPVQYHAAGDKYALLTAAYRCLLMFAKGF